MGCETPAVPRTGRLGFVGDYTGDVLTRFARVRNWTLEEVVTPEVRNYAGLRFGTDRIPGFIEHTGTFQGFGAVPPLFVGDEFDFIGYTAPTSGIPGSVGYAYVIPAIVNTLNVTWNWVAGNARADWTITFGSTGSIEELSTFDDDLDDDVFCDDNACELELRMFDCEDAEVDLCNLTSASLTFNGNVGSYSNSSTECQIRKIAGNLDWTMEIVDQNPFIVPIRQNTYWFEIDATLDPATFWILKFAMSMGATNFRVDTETNEPIGKTNNFAMKAVNCCNTPTRGEIVMPDGTTVWPMAVAS